MTMVTFHDIEKYGIDSEGEPFVELSFKTEHRGIFQCGWDGELYQFSSEPPFNTLKGSEQKDIEEIAKFVFYITHGELSE